MAIFLVRVEAWDETGNGDYYDVTVLAFNERSARSFATRSVGRQLGLTGAHSVEVAQLDHHSTGVIAIHKATAEAPQPMFTKEV